MQITRSTALHDLPEYLSVPEICVVVNIGKSLAYDLVRRGVLPSVRVGDRIVRIPRQGLLRWLEHEEDKSPGRMAI